MSLIELEAITQNNLSQDDMAKIIGSTIQSINVARGPISVGFRYGDRHYNHTSDFDAVLIVRADSIYLSIHTGNRTQCDNTVAAVSDGMRQSGVHEVLQEL